MTQEVKQLVLLQHNLLEPGTQLTRTFHVGGVAGGISEESSIITKFAGKLKSKI
jgi:DNA-directed RNA polymerase subunit beta'